MALEGRVYAVGLKGSDRSAKVMEHDGWKIGASMSMKRPGASVVAHEGKIYVFGGGGYSINTVERTTTAEVYDPVKDEWEKDFEFWALCTLNKKFLVETPFVNMNNNK